MYGEMALCKQPQTCVALGHKMVVCKAQNIETSLSEGFIKHLPYLLWVRFRYPL